MSVRPTARGWQAIFFGVLSLIVALLIGTTQIYQLSYALAGLLLVSFVLGLFLSRGLRYERRVSEGERLVAGRPAHAEITVSNVSRRWSSGVEMVDHFPSRRVFQTPPIRGTETRGIQEPMLFSKRGRYELGPAEVRTADPFGLLSFTRRFDERTEVTVYPEVFDLTSFPLRGSSREVSIRGSFAQQGDEFSGLREYRRGDDRRHIHWKSVARMGELVVREFSQEAPERHAVVLDLYRPGLGSMEDEVEDAIAAAGSVLRHLAREGLPSRLLCSDKARGTTTFGADKAAYWRTMDLLAAAQADGDVKPGDFLDEKLRERSEELGDGVVLVSRSLDDGLVDSVDRLRTAGLTVVVVALAAHTYRTGGEAGGASSGCEVAFEEAVRRLEFAGVAMRVVRRPGGLADFAGGRRTRRAV
ncbi:MAG: DUF58 domain-containing protein [Actinobacteria bacterium]|nr:DUF58 domain-containing protein [Actinomycetota bacterium]MCA1740205.1 DUF58 domain-containing protein [Actinomycetota bacterium]